MPRMQLQLYSLGQVPPTVPMWGLIMEDLAFPDVGAVMRVLGVEADQVNEWNRTGVAPKWACLALFWLTRWGRAEVHQQATHDAIVALQCLRGVERERDAAVQALDVMRHGLAQIGLVQAPSGYRGDAVPRLEVSEFDGPAPGVLRDGQVSVPRRGIEQSHGVTWSDAA